jgi:hypothetical protein
MTRDQEAAAPLVKIHYSRANPKNYSQARYSLNYYSTGGDQFAVMLTDSAMPRRVLICGFNTTDETEEWVSRMRVPKAGGDG